MPMNLENAPNSDAEKYDVSPNALVRARELIDIGRHSDALTILEGALRGDPDSPQLRSALAEALLPTDPKRAYEEAVRSVAEAPGNSRMHLVASVCASQANDLKSAMGHARIAVRQDPTSAHFRSWLAQTICSSADTGLLPEAQASADKAIVMDSNDPLSWYAHARVALLKNDLDEATRSFQQCLALDAEMPEATHALAHLSVHRGERATALSLLQNLVATSPRSQRARRDLDLQLTAVLGDILWAALPVATFLSALAIYLTSGR